jgi:CheY-like chemotaxis protein
MSTEKSKPLIMVVDDNQEFLDGITLTLEMEGYRVWTAVNGRDALDQLKAAFLGEDQQTGGMDRLPDLVMVDIMMPVMDGYALYEEMRANPYLNYIPLIFLTAKSGQEDIRYGKELGADDYLTKLASAEDILAAVRGKLKRVEQQRVLAHQFTGEPIEALGGSRILIAAVALALLAIGCVAGMILSNILF